MEINQVPEQEQPPNSQRSQINLSEQKIVTDLTQEQVIEKIPTPRIDQEPEQQDINLQVEQLQLQEQVAVQIEPITTVKPSTPEDIQLKPDTQTLQLLSLIINRLRILERNIAVNDDELREEHIQRESKLAKINTDINQMYEEYQMFMTNEDDLKELEKRIKVEIDYNLIRIMENKLKMDKEVYIMRKKLQERTVRMRELQVKVYNLKQEKKEHQFKIKEQEMKLEERDKEIRRLQDIVYDVTTLNIKPNFAMGSNKLSVPKYKNYDQYMITQQKDLQQQKYFLDNQTHRFGRKQGEVLKDGIWQTQLMGGSQSNKNLLQNTGRMMMQGIGGGGVLQGMSLNELLPDSWINSKYMNNLEKPRFEDTINERESNGGSSYKTNSIKSKDLSPLQQGINRNYY